MITITLNGEKTTIKPKATVADLLEDMGMNREGIAVAIDQRVVPRSKHKTHTISENSRVEVIRAVGGG